MLFALLIAANASLIVFPTVFSEPFDNYSALHYFTAKNEYDFPLQLSAIVYDPQTLVSPNSVLVLPNGTATFTFTTNRPAPFQDAITLYARHYETSEPVFLTEIQLNGLFSETKKQENNGLQNFLYNLAFYTFPTLVILYVLVNLFKWLDEPLLQLKRGRKKKVSNRLNKRF